MAALVLASTSPYRRALLARLHVPFDTDAPGVDEAAVKRVATSPEDAVRELAKRKALAVAARHKGAVVIGSDQCACIGGRIVDKPGSPAAAREQLRLLQGSEHRLLTAVAINHAGPLIEWTDSTVLHMRPLSPDEIARYVAADSPLDCAGSYKIEGLGIALFDRIECEDETAIMGLPLLRLCRELRALGFHLP